MAVLLGLKGVTLKEKYIKKIGLVVMFKWTVVIAEIIAEIIAGYF